MATSTLAHFCLLCLLILLLLPLLPTVFTYTKDDCNILLKSPALVTEQEINPLFMSRPGDFAFGFRRIKINEEENQYLLAIWFNRTKVPTIVRSEPATQGSELKLSSNNEFVLNDPQGKELWKAPRNGSKSGCAAILDNGNLLILDEQYNSIWESIKEPTDTTLPGQILYMKTTLRARESETNNSDGRFKLSLQQDGNLALSYLLSENNERVYFATTTLQRGLILNFTEAGFMFIQDANSSTNIYNLTKEDPGSKETFYHMARIDVDGSFRVYRHPRNGDTPSGGNESCSSSWIEVQSIPNDICRTLIDAVAAGGGFCGPNGYFRTPDYGLVIKGVDEKQCTQLCLDDCLCVVVIYEGNENACWKKKFPLSNGRYRESNTSIVLIKENIGSDKKDQSMVVVLALLLGSSAFLNILFFIASIVAFILYRKRLNSRWNIDSTLATNVRSYTYKELEEATRGFKQTVGKGASGTVYKGVLPSDSKRFVAVKKLGKVVITKQR